MFFFVLLFFAVSALEFFLVTRPGRWRFSVVILPLAAFLFWMSRQVCWTEIGPGGNMACMVEFILVGICSTASVTGAAAGGLWADKKKKK